MYVLDTNVLSELRNYPKVNSNVKAWETGINPAVMFISVIAVLELELGAKLKARKDPLQGKMLWEWLHQRILPTFKNRILPINTEVALRCASLHVPDPRSERDAMIAATALEHGFTVVTRNVTDFKNTGVPIVNPWEPSV